MLFFSSLVNPTWENTKIACARFNGAERIVIYHVVGSCATKDTFCSLLFLARLIIICLRVSPMNLPREIIYCVFEYLSKEHIAYAFLELNDQYASAVSYFIGKQLDLARIADANIARYCSSTLLSSLGSNLRRLTIGRSHDLFTDIDSIRIFCQHLTQLDVVCCSDTGDIRRYITYLVHDRLKSFTLMHDRKMIGEETSLRLLQKCRGEASRAFDVASSLVLHLSSTADLLLLDRFVQSSHLADGLYMIECLSTGRWLSDGQDDLCLRSDKLHREGIFSVEQIDADRCSREYRLVNAETQRRLSVLIPCEEQDERWFSSSILSTHRKESARSCSSFTFERVADDDQYFIRPCYRRARRLYVSGKRIIVSLCDQSTARNQAFKLHRIC